MSRVLAVFAALAVCFSATARASQIGDSLGYDPFLSWKEIRTEHFRITFPKELEKTAQKAAVYLEEANTAISTELLWKPVHRTQIVLVDNADSANGLTSAVARFGILLYITPPDNWFSTQYYDDWLRLVCFHEYTHLVNMDTATSFYKVLRFLFGDVLLPNASWPTWMLEGLAVYNETRFTTGGRGRSPYYEMILRGAVEDGVLDDPGFITLDEVNGTNPRFPFGETPYVFGFHLMNEVALTPNNGTTVDGDSTLRPGTKSHPGEGMLGEMSYRSGRRIPFFINDNLENISGKDWYTHWDDWVKSTRERELADIKIIRSSPVTKFTKLTQSGGQTLGSAFSADGQWMAFTSQTSDKENSLWLQKRDGKSAAIPVFDKISGATVVFTPDSKTAVFSSLNRKGLYNNYSDLVAYSLDSNSDYSLTDNLRARDPDISQDGKWIAFTMAGETSTKLAIAGVTTKNGKIRLGKHKIVFAPPAYDAIYTPKFSSDGKTIYFSWHKNGHTAEDIASFDMTSGKITTLVANGHMNRFPAVLGNDLYFESDLTGVDNIYRYTASGPVMITNTVTGFDFPVFDSKGTLYASVYAHTGFDIAQLDVDVAAPSTLDPRTLAVAPAPFPEGGRADTATPSTQDKPVDDYSIFPSIWPRQWLPGLLYSPGNLYVGGEMLGFDALDIHEYILGGAYDTLVHAPDFLVGYNNRSLGVNIALTAEGYTSNISTDSGDNLLGYERNFTYQAMAYLPIQYTYSTLTPMVSLYETRSFYMIPGANPTDSDIVWRSYWVPYIDAALQFSEAHNSPLAISTEEGRTTTIGSRVYLDSGQTFVKAYAGDTEYWRTDFLAEHSVLVPAVNYQWVDRTSNSGYENTNVTVEGRQSGRLLNTLPVDGLNQLAIRGYPLQTFYSKQAAVASLDYRFPIWHIFRGWGTNPVFLENLKGFVFGEDTFFPNGSLVKNLPAAGGGTQLEVTAFNLVPFVASVEYHKGFREDFGGVGEVFFQVGVNSPISF